MLVHYRSLSVHGARCRAEHVEKTAKRLCDVTCPKCLKMSRLNAMKPKDENPAVTIVHVLLDHEARIRAIEAKVGITVKQPDRIRILQAKVK
jgi:hypothetical protein